MPPVPVKRTPWEQYMEDSLKGINVWTLVKRLYTLPDALGADANLRQRIVLHMQGKRFRHEYAPTREVKIANTHLGEQL